MYRTSFCANKILRVLRNSRIHF